MVLQKRDQALALIRSGVEKQKIISIVSYVLSPYGEYLIESVCKEILSKYNREDILSIVYPAAKELAVNGTKANLKRAIFREQGMDPENDTEYSRGMRFFKEKLNEAGSMKRISASW